MTKAPIATLLILSISSFIHVAVAASEDDPKQQADVNTQSEAKKSKKDIYDNKNKDAEDPTRINTKLGFAGDYNFESDDYGYSISGSIGLSEAQKINLRVHPETGEWMLGGSWLFDFGIVNFNFGKSEYDDGSNFNNYSIGTFVPLSVFGIEPNGWQIFPMAGFNYTDGERAVEVDETQPEYNPSNPYVLHPSDSTGGYLGSFALKPINESFTVLGFAGASVGSDDYFGYWIGAGTGFKLDKRNTISLLGIITDNDYGSEQKIIIAYSYNFSALE